MRSVANFKYAATVPGERSAHSGREMCRLLQVQLACVSNHEVVEIDAAFRHMRGSAASGPPLLLRSVFDT
jgi:hypothetical protein